ncbi:helix-turn-helix domain-containing protein [Marinimicrobium alkaliphilum]|uniref:helix-turn-helix domain-containing protein n=1 Tax=Marinimicrobium alkaliphilum TaxID=2202654 RepID=UPI0018E06A39|nr:helix-turn-helix domain-containing protein [Marinimicrobium alkaliphilum]
MSQEFPSVPVFALYGEGDSWPTPDMIHCETIAERSQLHSWSIKPHRHGNLWHVLLVLKGKVETRFDSDRLTIDVPCVVFVPEGCIHAFEFTRDIDGYVVTVASPLIKELEPKLELGVGFEKFYSPAFYELSEDRHWIQMLFDGIFSNYRSDSPGRTLVMESLVGVLLAWVARNAQGSGDGAFGGQGAEERTFSKFQSLLEKNFRSQKTIAFYSDRMGVASARLNSISRRLSGRSSLEVIHERLLLEAKRNLTYTSMRINEVAYALGFVDPAYFNRFFKRMTGKTPKEFRQSISAH